MKASGSYASLVQGVSQQVPQDRRPGQHTEQINMLPDPVRGLARRHGSIFTAEKNLAFSTPSHFAAMTQDTTSWRTFEYSNGGKDYVMMVRRAARPGGSPLGPFLVYNRTDGVFLDYARPAVDAQLDLLETGGVSAITAIGKYVFMAGNTTVPTATSTDLWGAAGNQAEAALWIRGGAYARTFKVTATRTDGVQFTFSYTTPTSSYQGTLDTTHVPVFARDPAGGSETTTESGYVNPVSLSFGLHSMTLTKAAWNPTGLTVKNGAATLTSVGAPGLVTDATKFYWDTNGVWLHPSLVGNMVMTMSYTNDKVITNPAYAKITNDLVNEYNNAVTKWIGEAAEAIQPENIAISIASAAAVAGLASFSIVGSTVIWNNVKGLTVDDGGDGSLARAVANEVTSVDQLCDIHKVGKIVKVRARNAAEAFYMKATAKDSNFTTGYREVTWVEGAGTEHAITNALLYATVSGTSIYCASSAALLNSILPGAHPTYSVSRAGDAESNPLPFFVGKTITYLGVFQDRLLVGAGAVVRCSRIGEYLDFFQGSILTVTGDDPIEMLSQGNEDDVLRSSVLYDRDLIIFADKRQYAISGRNPLTPTSANMPVMSSHADAADLQPLSVGDVIFYGKLGETSSSVHQIQPGQNAESPESYLLSSQLDTYILGDAVELATHAKPAVLFVRTKAQRSSIYSYHFLDTTEGRKQDAWSRWDFHADLGPIIGMSATPDGLLVYSLRVAHGIVWAVADRCVLTSELSSRPYLDSVRPWATVAANTGSVRPSTGGSWRVAFDTSSEWKLLGDDLANQATLSAAYPSATGLMCGIDQAASVTPTNPFIKDRNGETIATGRLTVTTLYATVSQSSGFASDVVTKAGTDSRTYSGRIVGDPNNIIGRVPITTLQQSVPIGREVRDYTVTLKAKTWLPFTLTSLEWVGQFFNRTQRF